MLNRYVTSFWYCKENVKPFVTFHTCYVINNNNWALEVVVWWNNIIKLIGKKNKMLYLFGEPNVGKSSLVDMLIGRNSKYMYYPVSGQFHFGDFDVDVHKIVVFLF